jgi:acyl-coenzyme A thioesterase PaaI-like protein
MVGFADFSDEVEGNPFLFFFFLLFSLFFWINPRSLHTGPPGCVHGGNIATVLDELFGRIASLLVENQVNKSSLCHLLFLTHSQSISYLHRGITLS